MEHLQKEEFNRAELVFTKLDSVSQVVVLYNNCLTKIIIGSIIYVCAKICWKTWKLPPFVAHKYGEMIF